MSELISIIVPVYNTELYLEETIQSVLRQTYQNWELLLVDDGSTDDSASICKAFTKQDPRIHYLYKTNGGQASARNLGIKKSKGDWLAFLDSDDLWTEEKLSSQIEEVKKYKPDFLYGLGYFYTPEKEPVLEAYDWVSGEMIGIDFFNILYHSCSVNTNTVLFNKQLIQKVGYFNESQIMRGTEDWDYWMRIALSVDKVYGSPNRHVYYRIHPGGIHHQHISRLRGKIAIYSQYDNHKNIHRLHRLREYRYTYRELLNFLYAEQKSDQIKSEMANFAKKDPLGIGTLKQRILIKILPIPAFMWVSQKIIYRISYRLESLSYLLFIR